MHVLQCDLADGGGTEQAQLHPLISYDAHRALLILFPANDVTKKKMILMACNPLNTNL